jgi:3-hydroxybutyryl-CoA dehydrogenase
MQTKLIGVVGAGQMGSGISQICCLAGMQVLVHDRSENALDALRPNMRKAFDRQVEKGKLNADARDYALARLATAPLVSTLAECDFVIEAATEDIAIKSAILRELNTIVSAECVIATNTSSVSISMLAGSVDYPGRFVGMHFFNPVPVMRLVEIIPGLDTSEETVAKTKALAKLLGKTTVMTKNSPGFVVNRLVVPMINEAIFLLQNETATAEAIDAALTLGAGHPMGPLSLADMIGLDTCLAIMTVLHSEIGEDKYRPAPLLREMVDAGRLGRKSGRGFFIHSSSH